MEEKEAVYASVAPEILGEDVSGPDDMNVVNDDDKTDANPGNTEPEGAQDDDSTTKSS